MNITDRLCQTKEKDDRVSMMLLDPWVRFFGSFYVLYLFSSSTAAMPSLLTFAATADHDDHDKGLEICRVSSPLVFFTFQHFYTTSTRHDVTAIINNDIRRVGPLWGFFFSLHFVCLFCAYIWIFFPHIFRSG